MSADVELNDLHGPRPAVYRRDVRFRVLGPLEVDAGDGPVPLGGPKQRTVLAYLILNAGRVVPTEQLIDAVWGSDPPEAARNTLQSYVSNLRKAVGGDLLARRPPGYVLSVDAEHVDITRFEALMRDARRSAANGSGSITPEASSTTSPLNASAASDGRPVAGAGAATPVPSIFGSSARAI